MHAKKALLIAEVGINHNGNMELAEQMIRDAANAGADAVKFQNYKTEDFISDKNLTYTYKNRGKEVTESQYDMFKRCEINFEQLVYLKSVCEENNVIFFSTPTSKAGLKELQEVGVDYLKNGSDYLGHLPLIEDMGRSGIPTILSTGMAREEEITDAVNAYRRAGGEDLTLLACTSAYPSPKNSLNLRRIQTLAKKYECRAGFSDHSEGWDAAVAAVCLGACMVEKHFTIDRQLDGPDHWFSSTKEEFTELVKRVRQAEEMLGTAMLRPTTAEFNARKEFRISCTAAKELIKGSVLKTEDVAYRRPANGLPPKDLYKIEGKKLIRDISEGESLNLSDFEE